jgi:hypothetical protein
MNSLVKRFLFLTVPAVLVVLAGVELWVRASWDAKRGTPALYLSDPVLVQRFAPNYSGWFAGVPIRINNLGLRDRRDYSLDKASNSFRILLLGDSVAFGHGSIEEHTYARLLEKHLAAWRSDVDWQIWNAGVPGYNSSQELALLERVGPVYRPDLVIVGFHPNDIVSNDIVRNPGWRARTLSTARNGLKQWCYSYELYRRLYLQARSRLFASDGARQFLKNLADEDALLEAKSAEHIPEQQFTDLAPVPVEVQAGVPCGNDGSAVGRIEGFRQQQDYRAWRAAIDGFQDLQRRGEYRLMFFVSTAPDICKAVDLYFDAGARLWNDFFVRELAQGVPTVSTYDALARYRPSQMPGAHSHGLGNVNRLKADLLFRFLRDHVLPGSALEAHRQS